MSNITLFAQIINKIDRPLFNKIVHEHQGDKHNKGINSWTHLIAMIFFQFSKVNSLRDISNGLRSTMGNINHLGMSQVPSKSSLSYINSHRGWKIFRDLYYALYQRLSTQANFKKLKFKFKNKRILLLDSTIITLCLSLFDWAKFRTAKGGIKLHTLLNYDTCLPVYINITNANVNDAKVIKDIPIPANSVVVADRAYNDFETLYRWHLTGVKFVIRFKTNIKFVRYTEKELSNNKQQNILIDEEILFEEKSTREKYQKKLRRVVVYNPEKNEVIELITNQMTWTAETISELYKARWLIEIFFKEIKQHLRIKTFVGTSPNAVMIQIWTALITILMLKYLKQIAKYNWCLSNLVEFIRLTLFLKINLNQWLDNPFSPIEDDKLPRDVQLELF